MLNIQHFTKTYGEKKAVDDLSLHIAPGEIYGFIGHNGAGKTTTLKAAVGILQFDAGEITIGGHSIKTEPLACKQLRGQDHHTQVLLRHPAVRQRPHYGGRHLGAG